MKQKYEIGDAVMVQNNILVDTRAGIIAGVRLQKKDDKELFTYMLSGFNDWYWENALVLIKKQAKKP